MDGCLKSLHAFQKHKKTAQVPLTCGLRNILALYFTLYFTSERTFFFFFLISCLTIEQPGCELLKQMLHPTPDLAVPYWHAEQFASLCRALAFLTLSSKSTSHHHAHGQIIHNITILKHNIQRQICIGNASFVDLGLETEQVPIAAGMAAASGSCCISACSEFSITWC